MKNKEKLLHCPFCGKQPEYSINNSGIIVKCMNDECGVYVFTEGRISKKIARESWNTRVDI